MKKTIATWAVRLDCNCPYCEVDVDLLDYQDFWDGRQHIDIAEHGTKNSRNVYVMCPECDNEFVVDLEY